MLFNIALALGGIAAVRDRREAAAAACDVRHVFVILRRFTPSWFRRAATAKAEAGHYRIGSAEAVLAAYRLLRNNFSPRYSIATPSHAAKTPNG